MLRVDPFPYQEAAIDQGLDRGNLLIAYGMGLGKSLIQMGICEELLGDGEISLAALVVPASLKWQWAQALVWGTDVEPVEKRLKRQKILVPARHHCVVIDGTPEKRDQQYRYVHEYRPNYVILGYENVLNDWRQVRKMKPDLISLDEATAIKSFNAERSKKIKLWWAPYRYALTGTPIDNRADELFSIMEWVDPDELGRADLFDKAYVKRDSNKKVKGYKNLDVLHKKTKVFVARKTRFDPDVAPYMPKDFHKDYFTSLTGKTRTMYNEIAAEMEELLSSIVGYGGFDVGAYYSGDAQNSGSEEQGRAMACFNALTMLCDHPQELIESAKRFEDGFKAEKTVIHGSKYLWELWKDGRLDWITPDIVVPKMDEVLDRIDVVVGDPQAKVIVFSFSKYVLSVFERELRRMGIQAVQFTGDMTPSEKEAAKMAFKTKPEVRVFLSSDAGGMGVDLPEANYLINYNHPWSAGKADQRNSRHVRAGSAWDSVWVLNYIVENSVGEWKFNVLERKRQIGSAILDGGKVNERGEITFDVSSLLEWIREHRV